MEGGTFRKSVDLLRPTNLIFGRRRIGWVLVRLSAAIQLACTTAIVIITARRLGSSSVGKITKYYSSCLSIIDDVMNCCRKEVGICGKIYPHPRVYSP